MELMLEAELFDLVEDDAFCGGGAADVAHADEEDAFHENSGKNREELVKLFGSCGYD